VPKSDWFCSECLTAVKKEENDYQGGTEYSLSAFQKKCDQFKSKWFPGTPTEEECENEFWRLADNPKVNCQVEFGADLHSALYGR
jgi:histone demethylase JARID1